MISPDTHVAGGLFADQLKAKPHRSLDVPVSLCPSLQRNSIAVTGRYLPFAKGGLG